jgi:hypothetical protein
MSLFNDIRDALPWPAVNNAKYVNDAAEVAGDPARALHGTIDNPFSVLKGRPSIAGLAPLHMAYTSREVGGAFHADTAKRPK